MIDFIPLDWYTPIFDFSILWLVLRAAFQGFNGQMFDANAAAWKDTWAALFAGLIIIYMGLRPINIVFGDTVNYNAEFKAMQANMHLLQFTYQGEWVFNGLMMLFAKYSTIHYFFTFCASVYVGGMWWAVKRFFGNNYYLPFLVVLSMFTFWSYGVNGVRNGMAATLVILALSKQGKLNWQIILCFFAVGIHRSVIIVIIAAIISKYVKRPQLFLLIWMLAIIISAITGNFFADLLSGFVGDERFNQYLNSNEYAEDFSSTGFRWDFLAFSSLPVFIAWRFISKYKYNDATYNWLFSIYLIANAFWVLVIRAEYSNRFAQLSWFIMPLVLIYPYCMKEFWPNQSQKTAWALLLFYAYTFVYNIVLH
jgi:hypothetical protein